MPPLHTTAGFDFYCAFPQDAQHNRADAGRSIETPVLYLCAEGSRGSVEDYASGLRASGIKSLSAEVVAAAGHFLPDEKPAELWRLVPKFATSTAKPYPEGNG
jgi:pimeloyl-ACP methyl ester carboxylesterase